MIRVSALALGLMLAGVASAQAPAVPMAAPAQETLLLDLCLDGSCDGIAVVIVRGTQVLIERGALQRVGMAIDGLPSQRIDGRDFIAGDALDPAIQVRVDRVQLRLDIQRPARAMPAQHADLRTPRPALQGTHERSAYLNYAAGIGQHRASRNLFLDGAATRGAWSLSSTAQWLDDGGFHRGLTRLEFDQPQSLRRWTLGDQYAFSPDPLGGSALVGGVGVQSAFDLDPFLLIFPQPYLSGVLETPGTVEIYANGVLVGRQPLQAGPFSLQGLGLSPGQNDVRLVLRDPFGGLRELFTTSYYSASGLLAPGLSEYALHLGRVRPSPFEDRYLDQAVLAGFWRRGLSERFTLGGRIEATDDLGNAGVQAAMRLPVGEVSAAYARSSGAGLSGGASTLTYQYNNRLGSLSLGTRAFDRGYRRLGDEFLPDFLRQPRGDAFATASWSPLARLSFQANWSRNRYYGASAETRYGLSGRYRVADASQLLFAVTRSDDGTLRDTSVQLGLNLTFGRDNVSLGASHDHGGMGYNADINRSRPSDTGFGYDLSLNRHGGDDFAFGRGEYQGEHGRYTVIAQSAGGNSDASVLLSGALVAIGGRVFATPPVDSSFALARVPGLAGVEILRENLPMGRTDAHGDVLVRGLLPYYPNRIGYDDEDVPATWRAGVNELPAAVPRHGGALVLFDASPLRAIAGSLHLAHPGPGLLRLHGAQADLDTRIGSSGRFYLEDVAPGAYEVQVELDDGTHAHCTLQVPVAAAGVNQLGTIDCTAAEAP
ncbi:fimbria/pilus outer membrane usher protein [Cognatiluteimonas telluris]|uniref:fimbria/pilus outer membrane usher protein n=1 Tax=Cognatiluteimonas telluris TaxID=1104775 RepID=UPI00140A8235|nr:fimbria/pilus outer membrane usher protein [Lysobacter telluris]